MAKRRIGLGYTGLGSALVMLGIKYNSEAGLKFAETISASMRNTAYSASIELAKEKGAFPFFDKEKYLASKFLANLPEVIREDIEEFGIRNSHLISIAPTGTISLAFADNASNGIEPPFTWVYNRNKRNSDGTSTQYEVADHAWRLYRAMGGDVNNLPDYFVDALSITANEHAAVLKVVQPYVDSSISKTCNCPVDYPYEDFKDIYMNAWNWGLKGISTFRPNAVMGSVLAVKEEKPAPVAVMDNSEPESEELVSIDPLKLTIDNRPEGILNSISDKGYYYTQDGKFTYRLTIGFMNVEGVHNGMPITVKRPIEFFLGTDNSDGQQWINCQMRTLSLVARSGDFLDKAIKNMISVSWENGPVRLGKKIKADGTPIPANHISLVSALGWRIQQLLIESGFFDSYGNTKNYTDLLQYQEYEDECCVRIAEQYTEALQNTPEAPVSDVVVATGKMCPECGEHTLIKADGCTRCTSCGYIGTCG